MDRLNKWMTLIANIGVLAGIVFLAYEIRVNTDAVKAESAAGYAENWISSTINIDAESKRIMNKIDSQPWAATTAEDKGQVAGIAGAQLKVAEYAYIQWSEGNLDDRLWEGNERGLYHFFWGSKYIRNIWLEAVRNNFSTDFQRYVDAMIDDICSRRECDDRSMLAKPDPELVAGANAWLTIGRKR